MEAIEGIEGLWVASYNVLKRSGVDFKDQIVSKTKEEMMSISGMNGRILDNIEEACGIEFE